MTNDYSLTDIATATGGGRNNDGIFGGNGAWFLIILFLFAFMGWGGGWGGRGAIGGTDGVMNNYVLTSDFSQLSRQLSDAQPNASLIASTTVCVPVSTKSHNLSTALTCKRQITLLL